jgi:hypothetical protein
MVSKKTNNLIILSIQILTAILLNPFFTPNSYACCSIGTSGSGGGNGIIINNQLYLLDFVENGVEKNVQINLGRQLKKPSKQDLISNDEYQYVIIKSNNHEDYYKISDDHHLSRLNQLLKISSNQNEFMFGQELSSCKDKALKCLDLNTRLSIGLLNLFPLNKGTEFNFFSNQFLNKLQKLNWRILNSPLEPIYDINTPINNDLKYLMARRDQDDISIFSGAWSKGLTLTLTQKEKYNQLGNEVKPLQLNNKLGLITHEVFYALTADQGDINSNRARKINYAIYIYQNEAMRLLNTIEGRSVDNFSEAYYVHELPVGQIIEVPLPTSIDLNHLYSNDAPSGHAPESYWQRTPHIKPYFKFYTNKSEDNINLILNAGTRLKIKKVETQIKFGWYNTTIYFETPGKFDNEISMIDFIGANSGTSFATIKELSEALSPNFKFFINSHQSSEQ